MSGEAGATLDGELYSIFVGSGGRLDMARARIALDALFHTLSVPGRLPLLRFHDESGGTVEHARGALSDTRSLVVRVRVKAPLAPQALDGIFTCVAQILRASV